MLILDQALIWHIEATLRDPELRCLQEVEQYCAQKKCLLFSSRNLSKVALLVSVYQAERAELKLEIEIKIFILKG